MIKSGRRTPILRTALVVGATLLASLAPAMRASATPHMKGAAGEPVGLQEQVVRLFDRIDHVSRVIDSVRADMATVRDRISDLSREIEARRQLLNERAAEAYMAGSAGGMDSVLGASSFTDLQDALEYLDAISESDHAVVVSLEDRKAEIALQRVRLEALDVELRGRRERLEATAADLVEELRREPVLLARRASETLPNASAGDSPGPSPSPSPAPPTSVLGRKAVTKLIRDRFASLGSDTADVAVCVAEAESGLDPLIVNPATGASGLFQFLPSTWTGLSELAGRGGASVFDAGANADIAAWTVARYGWHPWRSVATACGA